MHDPAVTEVPRDHFDVSINYNGVLKEIPYKPDELVRQLLDHAIKAFGITQNPHLLGLFTKAGAELNDSQTAKAAGIHNEESLLLRPSTVRGG